MKPIYFDYNATTPIDSEVFEAMLPYLKENFGNPSSSHTYGKRAKTAVTNAREQVAKLIGAETDEVVFTSGGTESNNYALFGTAFANIKKGRHIITSQIEHPAIRKPLEYLEEKFNFKTTYLPVDEYGLVNPSDVRKSITKETSLITLMHANNETAPLNPSRRLGKSPKKKESRSTPTPRNPAGKSKLT